MMRMFDWAAVTTAVAKSTPASIAGFATATLPPRIIRRPDGERASALRRLDDVLDTAVEPDGRREDDERGDDVDGVVHAREDGGRRQQHVDGEEREEEPEAPAERPGDAHGSQHVE